MLFLGAGVGAGAVWLALRGRIEQARELGRREAAVDRATLAERLAAREQNVAELKSALAQAETQNASLARAVAELKQDAARMNTLLEQERVQTAEKLALLDKAKQDFADAFKALASDALSTNNESFLKLANSTLEKFQETAKGDLEKRQQAIGSLVEPVKTSLGKVEVHIQELEKARAGAYAGLSEQLKSLVQSEKDLRGETANLVKALRSPNVRGRWGEMQLRRVVELAGMIDHCDFQEQASETTEEGRLRPDLIVRLPGGVQIIVDAKTPLSAYLEAIEAPDEETRKLKLQEHSRQVQTHITSLSRKAYWEQFQPSPDFVILFLPGEAFYDAAREQAPELIEAAINDRVMIATPMSLITLLRAVAIGWRQEAIAHNAQEISELGKTLYKRLSTLGEHLLRLGKSLDASVKAYNETIGSVESQVLSAARRFNDLGAAGGADEIREIAPIDRSARNLQKIELLPSAQSAAAELARQEGAATAAERFDFGPPDQAAE